MVTFDSAIRLPARCLSTVTLRIWTPQAELPFWPWLLVSGPSWDACPFPQRPDMTSSWFHTSCLFCSFFMAITQQKLLEAQGRLGRSCEIAGAPGLRLRSPTRCPAPRASAATSPQPSQMEQGTGAVLCRSGAGKTSALYPGWSRNDYSFLKSCFFKKKKPKTKRDRSLCGLHSLDATL